MRKFLILAGGFSLSFAVLGAGPAGASLSPECDASAVLTGDDSTVNVDPKTTDRVKIPRKADVNYQGSIALPAGSQYTHSGEVVLEVAFMEIGLESWEWSGDTDKVSSVGTTDYDLDLPAGLLGGIKAKATGSHTQGGITCTGSLQIVIEGNALNAASGASAAITAAGAGGLALAALGKP